MTTCHAIALALVVGIVGGIRLMASPRTALAGNLLGATCMLGAVTLTLVEHGILGDELLWASMAGGAVLGAWLALRVAMVQMPQLVAALNGSGGAASAGVALVVLFQGVAGLDPFSRANCGLALALGTVTLSGSIVAAAKLAGWVRPRPIILKAHAALNGVLLVGATLLALAAPFVPGPALTSLSLAATGFAALGGIVMTIRIGGADMPITISLLNSLSGLAAAIAGFALGSPLLVAVGGIVGAAGLILTQAMCRAMNRSLIEVLTGRTTVAAARAAVVSAIRGTDSGVSEVTAREQIPQPADKPNPPQEADLRALLAAAKKVVIVPGYGMALAQAQYQVKQLMDALESGGREVAFAIHPVAGRMPGHMNVLLAEVDVPYEKLWELDTANAAFATTDLVVVIGANDVVNPAAMTAEGTPIYGMPILKVTEAGHIIVCNMDTAPGYAGVDNPLYNDARTTLLLGDAKDSIAAIVKGLAARGEQHAM